MKLKNTIKCKECGETQIHEAKGMCKRCYNIFNAKRYYQKHKEERKEYFKEWKEKNLDKYKKQKSEWAKENYPRTLKELQERRKANPDFFKERARLWRIKNPARYMVSQIKSRATKRGIDFNLKEEDITIPDTCPVLGIPLKYGGNKNKDNSPSVDRIDNSKGYTKDNICVISYRANSLKSNATIKEIEAVLKYMKGNGNGEKK